MTNKKLDTVKARADRIQKLLQELSAIGEMSFDRGARTGGLNWQAIGLAISYITGSSRDVIRIAYAAFEDWNQTGLCALIDYLFPNLHIHFSSDSQTWLESLQVIAALMNRGELLARETDGTVGNYRLSVKLEKLSKHNSTFRYVHIPGTLTHSAGCDFCEREAVHTDAVHYAELNKTILQSTAPARDSEPVVLKAASYEWICENCDHTNTEIEVLTRVQCTECGAVFATDGADHAEP